MSSPEISQSADKKLHVWTTMGVDPNEIETGAVKLPIDFVRYVLTAYQKARELAHGQEFVLQIGQNDFGRLLLANPDLQQVEQILSGAADEYTEKLLNVSRIRNSVVEAVYEIFGLEHVGKPFSLIEMLRQDEGFRQKMMDYLKKISESFDSDIYTDDISKQRPLLTGLLPTLPSGVQGRLNGITEKAEKKAKIKEEVLYPLSEADFATHVIDSGGYYIVQERIQPKDKKEPPIAQVLREIGSEIRRVLYADAKPFAEDIMRYWRLYSELDGLAFNTSGGGAARHVDPYYAEQLSDTDDSSPDSAQSRSYKLLVYPSKEAQGAIDTYIGPDKPGLSAGLREVILKGVKPVLREFLGVPNDGLDILNDLAQRKRKVHNCVTSLVTGGFSRLRTVSDWLSNDKEKQPVFPGDKKQWFISMYMDLAKQIEAETNRILGGDIK